MKNLSKLVLLTVLFVGGGTVANSQTPAQIIGRGEVLQALLGGLTTLLRGEMGGFDGVEGGWEVGRYAKSTVTVLLSGLTTLLDGVQSHQDGVEILALASPTV